MSSRELKMRFNLIPAGIFREQLNGLNRADILLISYSKDIYDLSGFIKPIREKFPDLPFFFADYKIVGISGLQPKEIDAGWLKNKKIAAFAAIGYPEGFFNIVESAGFKLARKIVYPDHQELSKAQFIILEKSLLSEGIEVLLITAKDKYHLPECEKNINILVVEVEMEITQEKDFFELVTNILEFKNK
jgi:tetraacyldisaccharide 4'-kinase